MIPILFLTGTPQSASAAVKMVRAPSMPGILSTLGGRKASASPDAAAPPSVSAALSRVSAPPQLNTGQPTSATVFRLFKSASVHCANEPTNFKPCGLVQLVA